MLRIKINAYVSSVGPIFLEKPYQDLDFSKTENNPVRCPDEESAVIMEEYEKLQARRYRRRNRYLCGFRMYQLV
jgi:chorismate synthase